MKRKLIYTLILSLVLVFSISEISAQRRSRSHHAHAIKSKNAKLIVKKHGRYASLPRWGARIRSIDVSSSIIKHKKRKYYFHAGVYYRKGLFKYRVVKAPIGIKINALPPTTVSIIGGSQPYYYYFGTFYKMNNDNSFESINAPLGALVEDLPEGVTEVEVDGEILYKLEDVYFKPIEKADNNLVYKTIIPK